MRNISFSPRSRSERTSTFSNTFVHRQVPAQHGSKQQQPAQPNNIDQKVRDNPSILAAPVPCPKSLCAPSRDMNPKAKLGQPLSTLIRRLEAATSRLEDIATSVDSTHPETVAAISTAQATIAENAAAAAAAAAMSAPAAATPSEPLPRSIEDFDKLINDDVKSFVTASEGIGGLVEQQVSRNIQSSRGTS
jgi:hypothetical protein